MTTYEHIEWHDTWVRGANNNSIPKLLLVGDSICGSSFGEVETAVKGTFFCARLSTSTCVADVAFDKQLALLLDYHKFAVIHFNNGLHGFHYDEPSYAQGLCRVLDYIKKLSPESRVIWASSTPMRQPGQLGKLDPRNDRIRERNRLAGEMAVKRKLPINDLYGCVIDHPDYFSDDGVHFNPAGLSALGKQVAQTVLMKA